MSLLAHANESVGITTTLVQAFGSVPGEGSTLQLGTGSESHQEHSLGNDHPVKEILSDAEETTRAAPVDSEALEARGRYLNYGIDRAGQGEALREHGASTKK